MGRVSFSFFNRLTQVPPNFATDIHQFKCDYRSWPTETTCHVFDGGLSVQEYTVPQASSLPVSARLSIEFVRSEGMGGGMVYSIRKNASNEDEIKCAHANHRSDIIARSASRLGVNPVNDLGFRSVALCRRCP